MVLNALWTLLYIGAFGWGVLIFLVFYIWMVPGAYHIWDIREGRAELTVEFAMVDMVANGPYASLLLIIAWFRARGRADKAEAVTTA